MQLKLNCLNVASQQTSDVLYEGVVVLLPDVSIYHKIEWRKYKRGKDNNLPSYSGSFQIGKPRKGAAGVKSSASIIRRSSSTR